jgi:CIC family chloride channel protein
VSVVESSPKQPSDGEVALSPLGLAVTESLRMARYLAFVVVPVGAVVGAAIGAYDWTVNELLWKHIAEHSLLVRIFSPAVGMLLTGCLLQIFRVRSSSMADEVVTAYHDPDVKMPVETAVAKLAASCTTMGFGASAGMEGASKWLGATIGLVAQRAFNRAGWRGVRWNRRTTMLAGGSAGIAAIFRAPLSGAVMGVESPYKHDLAHEALVPALVASAVSFFVFVHIRPATPYFPITFHYEPTAKDVVVAVPLGLSAGLASHLFLATLARLRRAFDKSTLPVPLRTAAGGLIVAGIAYASYLAVGRPVTLHSGLPLANDLLNGRYAFGACLTLFVLKLAATSVTFGSGGVGGLFVPTATIGAALAACWDAAVPGAHTGGVYTLLGVAAFSGASYNSLLFSAVFIAESTGNVFLVVPALIASAAAFVTSAGVSNSRAQRPRRLERQDRLAAVPIRSVMTRRIVTVSPAQTLDVFARSVLLGHHYKAVPVIEDDGLLRGMMSLARLRTVALEDWGRVRVEDVMDASAKTLCAHHCIADARRVLQAGADYVPIVDPLTYQLVGIVSTTDVERAPVPAAAESRPRLAS